MEWFVCLFLLAASTEDILERKVRNPLLLVLFAAVLVESAIMFICGRYDALTDRVAASALVFFSFFRIAVRAGGVGGADIKTAALLALHAGLIKTILFVPVSFFFMILFRLVGKAAGRAAASAPYIPFLSGAYIAAMLLL